MEDEIVTAPVSVEVVDIQFRPGQKIYYFDPDGTAIQAGDHVIIDTARGAEFGICTAGNHSIPEKDVISPLRKVLRMATPHDEKVVEENRSREKKAYAVCLQKIEEHKLDMQLVSAECTFDGSKILFYFTADERVDFRELVKNLASVFHTRIELRQIGVRDKAKMVGGLGICGRPFCCASFLEDFQPVSIKMAKTQNLSLNPTKISGTCGRLMCCLKYEQEAYEDLIRRSPKQDSFVDTPEGRGTVVELDLLRQRVKVRMEDAPETVSVFSNEDVAILRNGKAKKNDPPIPADLAPISGNGKRPHREPQEEEKMVLEPIRFRYSTEKIVDDEPASEEQRAGAQKADMEGKRRRRKPAGKPEKKGEPKAERKPQERREGKPQERKEGKPQEWKEGKSQVQKDGKPRREGRPEKPVSAEDAKPRGEQQPGDDKKPPRRRPNHNRRRKPAGRPEGKSEGKPEQKD